MQEEKEKDCCFGPTERAKFKEYRSLKYSLNLQEKASPTATVS